MEASSQAQFSGVQFPYLTADLEVESDLTVATFCSPEPAPKSKHITEE